MKAVIFDMDGVLVDSEPIHTLVLQGILADEGTDYTTEEVLQDGLGRSFPSQMGELILRLGLNKPIEHYATRFQEEILRCLGETAMPCPGAARLLDELGQRGYKLGLASSSASGIVSGTLEMLGFQDRFDVVVSGDMVAASKPDPDIFFLAAERLGVQPGECVVVEDSPRGVEGAKSAGMFVVAVRSGPVPESEISGADRVISSLEEFPWQVLGPSQHPPSRKTIA